MRPAGRRWGIGLAFHAGLLLGLVLPGILRAQADSSTLHATLKGWGEDAWLQLLDRSAAKGGRLSRNGILQRWDPQINHDYYLDLISGVFALTDDYDWYRRANGVRYWAASYNNRFLNSNLEVKVGVPLGGAWVGSVRFNQAERPFLNRNLVRIAFGRSWHSGFFGRAVGTLGPEKPDDDIEIQGGYQGRDGREIGVGLGMLDEFSNFIYQTLVVWPEFADTALDYERQPFTLRGWADWPIGRHLRLETQTGVMTPTTLRAYRQVAPDSGFRQKERYRFAGGLVEWSLSPHLRVGGYGTYVRAQIDRTPLPLSPPEDNFLLTEQTTRYGGFLLADLSRRLRLESWLGKTARPELRVQPEVDSLNVDYEDRWWSEDTRVVYGKRSGFTGTAAFQFVLRDVVRGEGEVAAPAPTDESRMWFEVGWRFGTRATCSAGYSIDPIDRGLQGAWDGAHGRFALYW